MLACNCLNLIIEVEGNDFEKVDKEKLKLTKEELEDHFFSQDILQVSKLNNINKVLSCLLETRTVGNWIIHYCINCAQHTHAVHREKGAACVLVNSQLLNNKKVAEVKASKTFSNLFNMVINPNNAVIDIHPSSMSYIPNEYEPIVRSLKQLTNDLLNKEALDVEERVKCFTEEQYRKLDNFRDRAFREQQTLIKIIISHSMNLSSKEVMEGKVHAMSSAKEVPENSNFVAANEKLNAIVQSQNIKSQKISNDEQIEIEESDALLFNCDGVNDITSEPMFDNEEESETEDCAEEDGINIKKRRESGTEVFARSLPMNIPTFLSQNNNGPNDDIDETLPADEKLDIAASIKALAKSVHGDPVFGDLPRPRFSTQI